MFLKGTKPLLESVKVDLFTTCGSNQTTCHWGFYFFRKLKGAIFFKKENYQSEKYKQKILAWKPSEAEQIVNTEIKAGL